MPQNKNILIIETDALHYQWLGFQGTPGLKTPNLDKLARERAVTFDNAFSCAAVCVPSRTSFMTGRYTIANGVVNNNVKRRGDAEPRLGRLLEQAGYTTGLFGKTHFAGNDNDMKGEGWQESFTVADSCKQYNDYLKENGVDAHYPEGKNIDRKPARYWNFGASKIPNEHYLENVLTDKGVNFIQRYKDNPFACYVSLVAPHSPFSPPEPYASMYDPKDMVLADRFEDELDGKPKQTKSWIKQNQKYINDDELRGWMATMYGLITMVDDNVGKLMEVLKKQNLLDDTLIVFTSDHGDFATRYGILGKSWTLTDDLIRTPLLVAAPGAEVHKSNALVQNIDVTTTILDWAGAEIPSRMHGKSFLPLLNNGKEKHRDYVFGYCQSEDSKNKLYQSMVRDEKWKYVESSGFQGELYDMENDPTERHNLINNQEYSDIVNDLRRQLLQWHINCSGGFYDVDRASYWADETLFYDETKFTGERIKKRDI